MTERIPVAWERREQTDVPQPVVREVPYVEIKLEHPELEPTGQLDRFYPDGISYGAGADARVFFWRPVLAAAGPDPGEWIGAVATTHGLAGIDAMPSSIPPLVGEHDDAVTVVVDGTIVGDALTVQLRGYEPPDVRIVTVSDSAVTVSLEGAEHSISAGSRCRISLPDRPVRDPADGTAATVSPVAAIRYPGRRTLHHPAIGTPDRLFPSFGLDLDAVPNPLPVPTQAGELAHDELADELGVDRSSRAYAERVLWQAFAFTAFDPHRETTPALGQTPAGHIVVSPNDG